MNNRSTILQELREISQVVADIPFSQTFTGVPPQYFEELPARVLDLIDRRNNMPDFGLNQTVTDSVTGAQVIMPVELSMPLQVPANYFDGLASTIMQRIRVAEANTADEEISVLSPLLQGLKNQPVFAVPDNYFSELAGNAIAGARAIEFVNDELENISPLMSGLRQQQVYEVPVGYFAQFPATVLSRIRPDAVLGKVIQVSFARRVMRYAAAAVFAGVVITGGWYFINRNNEVVQDPVAVIKSASDAEIAGFADNNTFSFADTPADSTAVSADLNDTDVKDLLADVSDQDLQNYLQENNDGNQTDRKQMN